jgi:poly(A) polymerase
MYYDPAAQTVLDYHHGMEDIRARTLRMIGDPVTRYREDPVRMLRVVRFAAKTGFEIDDHTREPIVGLASLIHNVPSARLFDEMLKLLMSGHAWASLQELRKAGLHKGLLPLLDVALEQPMGQRFVQLALDNTDRRVQAGKPVSPGFLFASLLWHHVLQRWNKLREQGEHPIAALNTAMDQVLEKQTGQLAIQRRFVTDMRDIWGCSRVSRSASAACRSACWNRRASAPATISCNCAAKPVNRRPKWASGGPTSRTLRPISAKR